ncbi:hypothetical protein [Agromyces italicus]|uniref:hypothetical protein n=1 Tax=Agromyces italicus TaxID=279572 RepID=UPI0003B63B5D|nr:hypothetical protein [Agromyces italicus]
MDGHDATPVRLIVDVANVMGSRPDGWWRDRAGAASRLLDALPPLVGREVRGPDGAVLRIAGVVAVVEGAAKAAVRPDGIAVVAAPADGDASIVEFAGDEASPHRTLVVTADRGLRARLADDVLTAGPGWLNELLGR